MTTRELILSRVAVGLRDVPTDERPEDVLVPREYLRALDVDVVDHFIERISEYKTTVRTIYAVDALEALAEQLHSRGLSRIAAPSDLPEDWRPTGVELVTGRLDAAALDAVGGALTGCALAIAETGTIVLDGGAARVDVRSRSSRTITSASSKRARSWERSGGDRSDRANAEEDAASGDLRFRSVGNLGHRVVARGRRPRPTNT